MTLIQIATAGSAAIILLASVWANLSVTVKDSIPVKLALACTSIAAYLAIFAPSEAVYAALVISIGSVCAALAYQRWVIKKRLFYRADEVKVTDIRNHRKAA